MEIFPPIADYGFLSDCEDSCLDRARRLGRVALPAAARFPERLRRPARPHRRHLPLRPTEHPRPAPAALPAGDHGARDHVAHADRLAAGPGPPGHPPGRGGCRAPARLPASTRATPRPPARCSGSPPASTARSRSSPTAYPLFEYGPRSVCGTTTGDGLRGDDGPPPERRPRARPLTSNLRLGTVGGRCYGRTTLEEGESAFIALSWADRPRPTEEEADASSTRP